MTEPRDVSQSNSSEPPQNKSTQNPQRETDDCPETLGTSVPEEQANPSGTFSTLPPTGTRPFPETTTTGHFPAELNASSLSFPVKAGRYLLTKEIAHGGMGAILLAEDEQFHRPLAIKVLLGQISASSPTGIRFFEEAQVMGQLQHPGIPPVHELGELPGGRPFFAMKLIQGETLSDQLKARTDASENLPHFLDVFEQICQTMGYAHAQGVIHRDLKPSNVMVGAFGEVQVMDWGLAKVLRREHAPSSSASTEKPPSTIQKALSQGASTETYAGSVMGTPAYMPPEQARGEIENLDERADVFGLGAIFCEILTGKPPYVGGSALEQAQEADLKSAFIALDECGADEELIQITKGCLSENSKERPRNAAELADRVSKYQAEVQERLHQERVQRVQADEEQKRLQLKVTEERRRRRISLALALLGVLFILALSGAGFWYVQNRAEQRLAEQKRLREKQQAEEQRLRLKLEAEQGIERACDGAEKSLGELITKLRSPTEFYKLMSKLPEWERLVVTCEASVNESVGILAGNPTLIDQELKRRVENLQQRIQTEKAHFLACQRLEKARMKAAALVEGSIDPSLAIPDYQQVFRDVLQLDVEKDDPNEIERRIREKSIHLCLIAHLDHWGIVALEPDREELASVRKRIIQLADRADLRDEWRSRFRRACLEEDDDNAFPELLLTLKPEVQNPYLIAAFATQLEHHEIDLVRFADLLSADFLSDYWLQLTLGNLAKEPATKISYYRTALGARDTSTPHYNIGVLCHQRRETDKAIRHYLKALQIDSQFALAHTNLCKAYFDKRELDLALKHGLKGVELVPEFPIAHNNLGSIYLEKMDLDRAQHHFEKAFKLDPQYAMPVNNLGIVFRARGDWDKAISHWVKALEIDPKLPLAHNNLGVAWQAKGEVAKAIQHYEKALELDPQSALPHFNLGNVARDKGDLDQAISRWLKAIELSPNLVEAHRNLCQAYKNKGDFDKALQHGLQAIELAPKFAVVYDNVASLYADRKDADKTIHYCLKALAIDPKLASAYYNLGVAHEIRGDRTQAIGQYLKAIEMDPKLFQAHNNLGTVYYANREMKKAIQHWEKAIALEPTFADAHSNLGLGYLETGELEQSTTHQRKAIELQPRTAKFHALLGMALGQSGDLTEARASFQTCLNLLPKTDPFRPRVQQMSERCELLLDVKEKLAKFDQNKEKPTDAKQLLALASLCQERWQQRYFQSFQFYRDAFRREPGLASDMTTHHRFFASCSAVLAAAGKGKDAMKLKEKDRADLRKQAEAWLRADLTSYTGFAKTSALHPAIHHELAQVINDPALSSVREPKALEKLPKDERVQWTKLWDDYKKLLQKTAAKE